MTCATFLTGGSVGCGSNSSIQGDTSVQSDTTLEAVDVTALADAIVWKSMNGPSGGATTFFAMDPYQPTALYTGTWHGLYRSDNKGENWTLHKSDVIQGADVRSIAFSKTRVFLCIGQRDLPGAVLAIDRDSGKTILTDQVCQSVWANNDQVVTTSSPMPGPEQPGPLLTVSVADAAGPLTSWTDRSPSSADLKYLLDAVPSDNGQPTIFPHAARLIPLKDRVVALLEVGPWDEAAIYVWDASDPTWKRVQVTAVAGLRVTRLVSDTTNKNHLFTTLRQTTSTSHTMGETFLESLDAGKTWTSVNNLTLEANDYSHVAVVGSTYYLATASNTFKLEGAKHDQVTMLDFGGAELVFDPADPTTVYGYSPSGGVYRSDDGMKTRKAVVSGIVASNVSNISIHPTDPKVIFSSGNHGFPPHRTVDGGKTWQRIEDASGMADELTFDPFDPTHLVLMDELTVCFATHDMGKTWTQIASRFLGSRVFSFVVSDTDQRFIYASTLGNGISRVDYLGEEPDIAWRYLQNSSDYAYSLALDPSDSDVLYASYSPKKFEDTASVWRFSYKDRDEPESNGWTRLLDVKDASGITALAVDKNDPSRLFAGVTGPYGMIQRSTDKGKTWKNANPAFTFVTVHALAIDPNDAQTIYAAPWGAGLFRSSDAGKSWSAIKTPTVSIYALAIDPGDSQTIYIADRTSPTIYRSIDKGATWSTLVSLSNESYYRIFGMTLHQGKLYFSAMRRASGMLALFQDPLSGHTFRLDGTTPTQLDGISRVAISFFSTGTELYAVSHIRGVFKLEGSNWTDISATLPDMAFFNLIGDGTTLLLAGGGDLNIAFNHRIGDDKVVNEIYRSLDGGKTWLGLLKDNRFESPIKQVLRHPTNASVLFVATQNGLYVSTDSGTNWQQQVSGLAFKNIGSMVVSKDMVYVGTLGGGVYAGTIGTDYSISWSKSAGPYPQIAQIQLKIDPSNTNVMYATSYPGGVFKSVDGGTTWSEQNFGMPSFSVTDSTLEGYYSLEIDPNQSQTLYLGIYKRGVYKSTDGAATWKPMYGTLGQNVALMSKAITRVKVDPTDSKRLYLATHDDGVHTSTDGAESWQKLSNGLDTPQILSLQIAKDGTPYVGTNGYGMYLYDKVKATWVHMQRVTGVGKWKVWERNMYQYSAFLFDPNTKDRLYLGHFPGGFYISEDGGKSWKNSSLGLGNDGIFSLAMHPKDGKILFAGTYNGVMKSTDGGKSWTTKSQGMPKEQWPFAVVFDTTDPSVMYTVTKNGQNKGFCDRNTFCGVVMKSTDGGENWTKIMDGLPDDAEYYAMILHPKNRNVLFLSSSKKVFLSIDAGAKWTPINAGLPATNNLVRDNVANNMALTPDLKYLVLGVMGYGVWHAEIPPLFPAR